MKKLVSSILGGVFKTTAAPIGEAVGEGIKEKAKRKTWKLFIVFGGVAAAILAFIFDLITIEELKEIVNIFTVIE